MMKSGWRIVFANISCGLRLAVGAAAFVLLALATGNAQVLDPTGSAGVGTATNAGSSTSSANVGDLFPTQDASPQSEPNQTQTEQSQPAQNELPPSAPSQDEKKRLSVNPITGSVTSSGINYKPLTKDERWKLYFKMNYFSVGAYFGPFFTALLLDQATNSPSQWGGGFPGYGRRVASRVGSAILQGTFQAPVAAVLHEDVRYIASSQGGAKHRAWHAVVYSFLTYNNQGHPTLNVANLGGYYASTAASTAWLPGRYNLAGYTFSNGSEQIALSVPVNLFQEFWPEIHRTVFHRH